MWHSWGIWENTSYFFVWDRKSCFRGLCSEGINFLLTSCPPCWSLIGVPTCSSECFSKARRRGGGAHANSGGGASVCCTWRVLNLWPWICDVWTLQSVVPASRGSCVKLRQAEGCQRAPISSAVPLLVCKASSETLFTFFPTWALWVPDMVSPQCGEILTPSSSVSVTLGPPGWPRTIPASQDRSIQSARWTNEF